LFIGRPAPPSAQRGFAPPPPSPRPPCRCICLLPLHLGLRLVLVVLAVVVVAVVVVLGCCSRCCCSRRAKDCGCQIRIGRGRLFQRIEERATRTSSLSMSVSWSLVLFPPPPASCRCRGWPERPISNRCRCNSLTSSSPSCCGIVRRCYPNRRRRHDNDVATGTLDMARISALTEVPKNQCMMMPAAVVVPSVAIIGRG
jgi:hypothetical protein